MAVLPISSVNTGKHTVNFQGRKRNIDNNIVEEQTNQSKSAGKMVTVPVAVLMALATTSLNAKEPANQGFDRNIDQTELLAYTSPAEQVSQTDPSATADYYTYLNKLKKSGKVIKTMEVPGKRESYTMVFMRDAAYKGGTDCCSKVILLSHLYAFDKKSLFDDPPEVTALLYHNIGKEQEYCGAIVECTRKSDEDLAFIKREVRLPDEVANEIIDLIVGDAKYANLTNIEFKKTTNPKLTPMSVTAVKN